MTDTTPDAAAPYAKVPDAAAPDRIDELVAGWRAALLGRPGVDPTDADELEDHLRGHVAALTGVGLTADEAVLVGVQRLGPQHAIAADLAREHADRLWKQHVGVRADKDQRRRAGWPVLLFAVLAGLAVRIPFGFLTREGGDGDPRTFVQILVALAAVATGYLAWVRRPPVAKVVAGVGVLLAVVAVTQLAYPYDAPRHTQVLALLHAAILLMIALGAVYLGRDWRAVDRWMDYVRFLGEWFIYYVLLGMGGGVLIGLAAGVLSLVGADAAAVLGEWVYPLGIGGAVIIAAWLVEAKQGVIENMAPVLAAVFTPLFTLLLVVFLGVLVASGDAVRADRELLILVDVVLAVILGLHLFTVSARPAGRPPGWSDRLQFAMVVAALVLDVVVLAAMAGRIGEFGASPNKLAALGENLVLAGNLAGAAWLSVGFLRGRRPYAALARWQCRYLGVIAAWAAFVLFVLPPVFGFR